MFRPLELFIGLRYTRAKRRNHFISFISSVSMLGIAVGVTALITVISVMNGFELELRTRILGMVAHATISGAGGALEGWADAVQQVKQHPQVLGAAPYIEREAMLQGGRVSGAIVRGVMPELEPGVSELDTQMIYGKLGDLRPGEFGLVLGVELAMVLGVEAGDSVLVYAPQVRASPAGAIPRVKRFKVVGMFEAGMQEYDRGMAVMHMDDAARLFEFGAGVTGVRLKLDDMFQAYSVARDLGDQMGGMYRVKDWTREHYNFFRAVKTEKLVMFVILSLIVAVAAFNLVSTLVMVVTDKQADIAILRTLGISPASIMGVFMVQGMIAGLFGTLLGVVGGVLLASNLEALVKWIEKSLGVDVLSADVYYINELPSKLNWADVGSIALVAFVFSVLATLYPAWRASRTLPAQALRYE